jgi:hypothetical protein
VRARRQLSETERFGCNGFGFFLLSGAREMVRQGKDLRRERRFGRRRSGRRPNGRGGTYELEKLAVFALIIVVLV